jgi:predicted negative regulator of RcsB-dependent stress response
MAYQQIPNAEETSLNLAEALISNKQYDEALKVLDTVTSSREISKKRKALLLDRIPN